MSNVSKLPFRSILRREFINRTVETLNPKPAICISPKLSLREALAALASDQRGCLILCDGAQKPVGIFSDRDVVTKLIGSPAALLTKPISDFMTKNPETVKANASIARVVHAMSLGGFRHVPVEPTATAPLRILSVKDFVDTLHTRLTSQILDPENSIQFEKNQVDQFFNDQIAALKPDAPLSLPESTLVIKAVELLRKERRGAVTVTTTKGRLVGIFSERDLLTRVIVPGLDPTTELLGTHMTKNPATVLATGSVALVFELFSNSGYRHLPVVDAEEKLIGMISVRHLLGRLTESILGDLKR